MKPIVAMGGSAALLLGACSLVNAVDDATPATSTSTTTSTGSGGSDTPDGGGGCSGLLCGAECVDPNTSHEHCGGCNQPCLPAEACVTGGCTTECPLEQTMCTGACVDLLTDPLHCNACDHVCPDAANAAPTCTDGACGWECLPGFGDCSGGPSDGCETDTNTGVQNCGGCGAPCAAIANGTPACSGGQCAVGSCNANWGDCDHLPGTGCETDLLTTNAHCTGCDLPCDPNLVCQDGGCVSPVAHAVCADVLTDASVWGVVSRGLDLRAWTGSTLHYLGCPNAGGDPTTFYCQSDVQAQTLSFGSPSCTIRAAVDPGNALGDTMPTTFSGCCTGPLGLCNGPDANNNGISGNAAQALCWALGYQTGQLVAWVNSNTCPEIHTNTVDGLSWGSDWVASSGYGREWLCTGYR